MIGDVARTMLSLRPLVDVLDVPIRVAGGLPADRCDAAEGLLRRVAALLGTPPLLPVPSGSELGIFERVVSDRLALGGWPPPTCVAALRADLLERAVDDAVVDAFDRRGLRSEASSFDGAAIPVYTAGPRDGPPVVIASACGMPAKLCDRWVRFLEEDHFVVLWETRGMFGDAAGRELGAEDVDAQARDLCAVMDHAGVDRAHVIGLCGGGVIALAAAVAFPARVSSLSLWHGDFELGADGPRTSHQRNLKSLMSMVAGSSVDAAAMHAAFCQAMLTKTARLTMDLSHLILYPYATPRLLARYCRLNGSIMGTDVRPWLGRVVQPTLVVTSADDDTAHPGGSIAVANALAGATLHVAPHGNHLSLFEAAPDLLHLAARFLRQAGPQ